MLMILARLVRSESFWAVVKVRSPHNRPEVWYPRLNALAGAREQRCARIEASERVQASHRTGHVRG